MIGQVEAKTNRRWCILRTAGPRTLPLAHSLAEAGFEAWTPRAVGTRVRRRGLSRERVEVEVEGPIVPTFVFVPADRLPDIARLLADPMHPHPAFSLFRFAGRIPLIADRDISALRAAEANAALVRLKGQRHHIAEGTPVRVKDGCALGVRGTVLSCNGKMAAIDIGARIPWIVEAWLLDVDQVENASALPERLAA